MAKLTSDMKAMLSKQLAVVATASQSGVPNAGPKGSVLAIDDETLAYSESTQGKTFNNLQENPNVAVMVIDREKSDGFQIKGQAELVTSGNLFEQIARRQEERKKPRPKYVVRIAIDEIYSVGSGMKGKRLA